MQFGLFACCELLVLFLCLPSSLSCVHVSSSCVPVSDVMFAASRLVVVFLVTSCFGSPSFVIVCSALFASSCCQVLSPVSCSPPGLFAVLILLSVTFCSYFCISVCSLIPNKVLHFVHFCLPLCLRLAPAAPVPENYLRPYTVYKRWT